jgi:hypothetical protein
MTTAPSRRHIAAGANALLFAVLASTASSACEWGREISLTGNYAQLNGRDYLAALLGFSLRFPFGAGVIVLGH